MAPEYAETLSSVLKALEPIGFAPIRDDSFLYVLEQSGHFVVLIGEPYAGGAFNLGIAWAWPTAPDAVFGLRLLMQVFGDPAKPSLENQLNFLISNLTALFDDRAVYETQYRILNRG